MGRGRRQPHPARDGITLGRLQGGGQRAKAEIADYVLVYRNTKLAVIEARAWNEPSPKASGQHPRLPVARRLTTGPKLPASQCCATIPL